MIFCMCFSVREVSVGCYKSPPKHLEIVVCSNRVLACVQVSCKYCKFCRRWGSNLNVAFLESLARWPTFWGIQNSNEVEFFAILYWWYVKCSVEKHKCVKNGSLWCVLHHQRKV